MFDLLTVVFRDELNVLQVQAQSIDLYCHDIGIQNIFVIVNDNNDVLKRIDTSWYGSFCDRVTVVPVSQFDFVPSDNGWLSQQVLKMLGSTLSQNEYTVILDAKTIFVQDYLVKNIINSNNQLRVGLQSIPEVFTQSQKIASNVFGVDLQHSIGPSGVPFVFKNDLVQSMIRQIESRTNTKFADWFQSMGMLTEFILYSGYVLYTYRSFDQVITNQHYRVSNVCHSEVNIFDKKFHQMLHNNILTVSVHRNAWTKLTDKQKQQYINFLVSRNINSAENLL